VRRLVIGDTEPENRTMSTTILWRAVLVGVLAAFAADLSAQVRPGDTPLVAEPIKVLEPGPVPAGVVAGATSPTSVHVSWQAAPGASGYLVHRGGSAQGQWVQVTAQPVTTTGFTDAGLAPFLEVFYRVEARYPDKAPGVGAPLGGKKPTAPPPRVTGKGAPHRPVHHTL
jgi:hypothetical protein